MDDPNDLQPLTPEPELQSQSPHSSGGRNWFVIAIMALALVGMLAVGVHNARKRTASGGNLAGNAAGQSAPDFNLKDVNTGKAVRLSDYRGKAVVLNFWATWCPPCKVEIPWFVDLQKQYADDGLVVLGVAMDDASQEEIAKFAQDMNINYPILLGTEDVGDRYGGVEGLPTTFYIGRDGKILDRVAGLRSHREIESNVKAALGSAQRIADSTPRI